MYPLALQMQQARIEHMLYEEQDRLDDLAAWAEYLHNERNDRISEAMEAIEDLEQENFIKMPSKEREDLELAMQLRELAERIESKWS